MPPPISIHPGGDRKTQGVYCQDARVSGVCLRNRYVVSLRDPRSVVSRTDRIPAANPCLKLQWISDDWGGESSTEMVRSWVVEQVSTFFAIMWFTSTPPDFRFQDGKGRHRYHPELRWQCTRLSLSIPPQPSRLALTVCSVLLLQVGRFLVKALHQAFLDKGRNWRQAPPRNGAEGGRCKPFTGNWMSILKIRRKLSAERNRWTA